MEEAAGEFVVDQKIGRLAPVNARNRRAHHVAALAVGPKQKAGGSSHRPRRVSKAAAASVTITNRGRLRAVCRKQKSGQRRRDSASHPAKRRSAGRWGTRPALKIRPRQYQVVNQLHAPFVREVEMPRGQLSRKSRSTQIRGVRERIGEGRRWGCPIDRPTAKGTTCRSRRSPARRKSTNRWPRARPARVLTTVAERAAMWASAAQTRLPCAKAQGKHRFYQSKLDDGGGSSPAYGAINPERIAYRTMLAVSWTPSFSRIRLRCESAVL